MEMVDDSFLEAKALNIIDLPLSTVNAPCGSKKFQISFFSNKDNNLACLGNIWFHVLYRQLLPDKFSIMQLQCLP